MDTGPWWLRLDQGESKMYTEILVQEWTCWEVTEQRVRELAMCGDKKPEQSGGCEAITEHSHP